VVSWISQGAAGLATGSQEVMGYPRDGTGATEAGAVGCRVMSGDVGKGLDLKWDERETSCTAGDELCHGRQGMPREMSYATGDEVSRGRQVGSGRHIGRRGIRGKTEWGKGVPLTDKSTPHHLRVAHEGMGYGIHPDCKR